MWIHTCAGDSTSKNLQMEATGEANMAATIVRSHIFHNFDDESEGDCINDPWPGNESGGDRLIGITIEADPPSACAPKKGGELPKMIGDDVLTFGREGMPDKVVESEVPEEAEKSCVDGLQGLKIGDKRLTEKLKVLICLNEPNGGYSCLEICGQDCYLRLLGFPTTVIGILDKVPSPIWKLR
uniref:Uncharacterized protein n=1 Tax=Lactuca sativa TaxID=4236 RepID=A0A9R1XTV7_LACSA|nr:hypothetical protein LSAT_V11C200073890 [Lactuca sativa]